MSTWGSRLDKKESEARIYKLEMQLHTARTEVLVLERVVEELRQALREAIAREHAR